MAYSQQTLDKFRAAIAMYEAIGRGELVEWVCPCPDDANDCPAAASSVGVVCCVNKAKLCEGPGGPWKNIRTYARISAMLGKALHPKSEAIKAQAQAKAAAWAAWLAEEEA